AGAGRVRAHVVGGRAGGLAVRGQGHVEHELQRTQAGAQGFGEAVERVARIEVDVGVGPAPAFVDVGVHVPRSVAVHGIVREMRAPGNAPRFSRRGGGGRP